MEIFKEYLNKIQSSEQRERMEEVLWWICARFPSLEAVIKWNQPMFLEHGTFIIGFSIAKNHIAFSPEEAGINTFSEDIRNSGYEHTKGLAKIKWIDEVDYSLLQRIIEFNIADKKDCAAFFRNQLKS